MRIEGSFRQKGTTHFILILSIKLNMRRSNIYFVSILFQFAFVFIFISGNAETAFDEYQCPDDERGPDLTSLALLSRTKRSFGGKEAVNITLVNTNVLGAPGWLPLICGAVLDMIFHVSGYIVMGKLFRYCNYLANPPIVKLSCFFLQNFIQANAFKIINPS